MRITQQELRLELRYEPETGLFIRRSIGSGPVRPDGVAGRTNAEGYVKIKVGTQEFQAHHLAWLYVTGEWPKDQIDHIDRNPSNNRWGTLRPATNGQNKINSRTNRNNTSGFKGVSWHKKSGLYVARLGACGRRVSLGYFTDPVEAHAAYCRAATAVHGEFVPPEFRL